MKNFLIGLFLFIAASAWALVPSKIEGWEFPIYQTQQTIGGTTYTNYFSPQPENSGTSTTQHIGSFDFTSSIFNDGSSSTSTGMKIGDFYFKTVSGGSNPWEN